MAMKKNLVGSALLRGLIAGVVAVVFHATISAFFQQGLTSAILVVGGLLGAGTWLVTALITYTGCQPTRGKRATKSGQISTSDSDQLIRLGKPGHP